MWRLISVSPVDTFSLICVISECTLRIFSLQKAMGCIENQSVDLLATIEFKAITGIGIAALIELDCLAHCLL